MARHGQRGLSPEELELWRRVAQTARPLRPGRAPSAPPPARAAAAHPAAAAPAPPRPAPDPIPPFRIGELAGGQGPGRGLVSALGAAPPGGPPRLDAGVVARLVRGKLNPEARIDLHGLTLAEAEPALVRFVLSSQAAGRRLVLVITGKGRAADAGGPIPARQGVLRAQVPRWLARPPLAELVVASLPAHGRHGGEGALYVWLRRTPRRERG
jgi:DNA-nicking Smr family endonuclease